MFALCRWPVQLSAAILLTALSLNSVVRAADKPAAGGKVAGIYFDKKDNYITVKADGEEEPVKYLIDPADKRLAEAFKSIFGAARVQLTYKQDGDDRRLVTIKKQVLKATGTVTGIVVGFHNNFWLEVKPKNGVADAYAPGANYKDKQFMDLLKSLQPGDSVTLTFNTDFERHRILSLRKNAEKPDSSGKPQSPAGKDKN